MSNAQGLRAMKKARPDWDGIAVICLKAWIAVSLGIILGMSLLDWMQN